MICSKTQRWLLTHDQNETPEASIHGHLADCPQCRGMQKRLLWVESLVGQIPVPATSARQRFVDQIRMGPSDLTTIQSPADRWLTKHPLRSRERGIRKVALAVALAASLAIVAFGLWNLPKNNPGQQVNKDSLTTRRLERDQKLAAKKTPRERVEVLQGIAKNLEMEAMQLAKQKRNEDLRILARFYQEVVGENLLQDARLLQPDERIDVIRPVMVMLANLQSEIERNRGSIPKSTFDCLDEMLVAARDTQLRLDKLIAG